jgi:hypothetical protein
MNRSVRNLLVAAISWSAALIPGALFLPIGDPENLAYQFHGETVNLWVSLTRINGTGILWIPIVTLILTLIAAYCLALQVRSNSQAPSLAAIGIGAVILVGAVVGTVTFLIGIFLAPGAIFLLFATEHSRDAWRLRRDTTQCRCGWVGDVSSRFCPACGESLEGTASPSALS